MHWLSIERDHPTVSPVSAEDRMCKFRSASANQAREAKDFTAMEINAGLFERVVLGSEFLDRECYLATRNSWWRVGNLEITAHHELDHRIVRNGLSFKVPDVAAITQDNHAIAGLDHLMQAMGDKHYRHAVRLEL